MKKLITAILLLAMSATFCACGAKEPAAEVAQKPVDTDIAQKNTGYEADIKINMKDGGAASGIMHRTIVEVTNLADNYLTAEIECTLLDINNNEMGSTTIFVNNLASGETISEPFLAKNADGYGVEKTIKSYKFTDKLNEAPELTSENVKNYIRLTHKDYGDIQDNKKEIVCEIHNLTTKYFSGDLTVIVKDKNSSVVGGDTFKISNLGGYKNDSKFVWFPILDEYTVDYEITNFKASANPIP